MQLGDLYLSCRNWPFQCRGSSCIAVTLIWQQASSPDDLTKVLVYLVDKWTGWKETEHTHLTKSCLQNLWSVVQSQCSGQILSPKRLIDLHCIHDITGHSIGKANLPNKISVRRASDTLDSSPTKGLPSSIPCGKTSSSIMWFWVRCIIKPLSWAKWRRKDANQFTHTCQHILSQASNICA